MSEITDAFDLPDLDLVADDKREEVIEAFRSEAEKVARIASLGLSDVLSMTFTERAIFADVAKQLATERAIMVGKALRGDVAELLAPFDGGDALVTEALDGMLDDMTDRAALARARAR